MRKTITKIQFMLANYACISLIIVLFAMNGFAQGVSINQTGEPPDPSAMLDVVSTSKGVLVPRMTLAERINISQPANGLLVFQTDEPMGFYYNAGSPANPNWQQLNIGLKEGNAEGEMLYWNGTDWVAVLPGNNNQKLFFCNGSPSWGGCLPVVTTFEAYDITSTNAYTGGIVVDDFDFVSDKGICWSTNPKPTMTCNILRQGMGVGTFHINITGLEPGTTYYIRAYASNSIGTSYGNEWSFSTPHTLPVIYTLDISSFNSDTIVTGGNITCDGGSAVIERGVCWAEIPSPTIFHNVTSDGEGIGQFISVVEGLQQSETYYIRAYAINSSGIAYGNEISFSYSGNNAIMISPTSFYESLLLGDSSVQQISIKNLGTSPIDFSLEVLCWEANASQSGESNSKEKISIIEDIELSKTSSGGGEPKMDGSRNEIVLNYDGPNVDAIGLTAGGTFHVAARFPSSMVGQYSGYVLTSVEVYINDVPSGANLKIWGAGSGTAPGAVLHQQTFTSSASSWVDVQLSNPVLLDGNDIWVGYEVTHGTGQYPAGCDAGPAHEDGAWISLDGVQWSRLYELAPQLNYNWNIRGYLSPETPTPPWLTLTPISGTIQPGETFNINAKFAGLTVGYEDFCLVVTIEEFTPFGPYPGEFWVKGDPVIITKPVFVNIIEFWSGGEFLYIPPFKSITQKGIVWNDAIDPTISDRLSFNSCGFGPDDYDCFDNFGWNYDKIQENTTYYVRAYAVVDGKYYYGNNVTFSTPPRCAGCPDIPLVTDIDDNTYETVQIGFQCWLKENLKTTRYQDGHDITWWPTDWASNANGAYSIYDNNDSYLEIYGALYNYHAVNSPRGLCPEGWNVANSDDWYELFEYVTKDWPNIGTALALNSCLMDGSIIQGCDSPDHPSWFPCVWKEPNFPEDLFGFSGLGGGKRNPIGSFQYLRCMGSYWATPGLYTNYNSPSIVTSTNTGFWPSYSIGDGIPWTTGASVRCIKDRPQPKFAPTVSTNSVTNITHINVTAQGSLSSNGGADINEYGFVWHTSEFPTTIYNIGKVTLLNYTGAFPYNFQSIIGNLLPGIKYYIRAYATNSAGTSYGINRVFMTATLSSNPCPEMPTVYDARDGNTYSTIKIGNQCWMAENLAYLPSVSPSNIGSNTINFNYVYGYEGSSVWDAKNTDNYQNYGVLYNWPAAQSACPSGWKLPPLNDWNTLIQFLGGGSDVLAGARMKSHRTADMDDHPRWNSPNLVTSPPSGFEAFPGGVRFAPNNLPQFWSLGGYGAWWSSTSVAIPNNYSIFIGCTNYEAKTTTSMCKKYTGLSIRCLKIE